MSCGDKCAKFFLFTVNVLVWLVGAAFLAIGIWVAVSPSTFISNAMTAIQVGAQGNQYSVALASQIMANSSLMMIGAYVMIGIGGFLFLVGFCGCCGACKESTCLLVLYIIFCVLAFLVTLAAGVLEAVYLNNINNYITQGFVGLQNMNFDGRYNSTDPLSQVWYSIMQAKTCCGVNGPGDFTTNYTSMAQKWSNNNRYTCAGSGQCFSNAQIPVSCCPLMPGNYTVVNPNCPMSSTGAYTTSCQSVFITPLTNELSTYATIVMGVTFGLAAFCLLAVAAAATLIHHQKNGGDKAPYA